MSMRDRGPHRPTPIALFPRHLGDYPLVAACDFSNLASRMMSLCGVAVSVIEILRGRAQVASGRQRWLVRTARQERRPAPLEDAICF